MSTSSSEEDLSLFQSVAVSAADIAESARKEAESATRRRSSMVKSTSQQQPAAEDAGAEDAAADGSTPAPHHNAHGQDDHGELDITSRRIATALDAILARQLGDAQATQQQPPAAAAAAVEHSPGSAPAAAPSSAAETALDDADISDVRLFRGVAPGTPCVIQSNEYGGSSSSVYGLQHPPKAAAAGQVHLHPAWGAQRPFRSIRAMIPRLNLAETSSSGSKKRHAAAMQMLSVDGAALLAAAGKAETAWKQLQQLQEQQQEQQQQEQGKKKKKKKSGVLTHAMIQAWQGMRKTKVEGVVLEAKQFVPYETRIAKLLGQQNTGSKDTATAAIASS